MASFSAQVSAWAAQSEQRITAVFRQSAQGVAREVKKPVAAGGNMRVKTGFLRASLMASTSQMPRINPEAKPATGAADNSYSEDQNVTLVIAGADIGQTIYLGFTASYARPREYEDGFVRLAAQRWPQIVEECARLIKSRVEARAR
ncbi:hypothetical protein GCM10011321_14660 [Youhaiella tibetensis]|uniref:HK97 gp10 family phage protein n=1 Tax=Paradevosia tibetensis TaxID=1447062 RepID=A0A5B9DMK3_9HYPH|nr:HK97 gp10 family phage protein [Youhaiella tibetensis]QEE20417.1 HK97 gp10 family phage protein [Youhaiella tibetensis]GGF24350.1 hypothetical protein GCM10011321_14660 [Youhaiella tibetensis]